LRDDRHKSFQTFHGKLKKLSQVYKSKW